MGRVVLSIGMIVKNEIRCLEKCMKALEPLRAAVPCELVIADTGSTDGTREIAARYADIFFDLEWENDFSAARNAVLARCSGDWYLSIDADEYLDPDIEEFAKLLLDPAFATRKENCGVITICNYKDQSLDKETATSFLAFRFMKRTPEARFIGKIHENIYRDPSETVLDLSFVVFWHDGYAYESQEKAIQKCNRNMQLLEEELSKKPNDPLLLIQCIESSRTAEEKLKYVYRGLKSLHADASNWELQGPSLLRYAVQMGIIMGLPQVSEWAEMAFKQYPDSHVTQIDVNGMLVQYYMRTYRWNKALKYSDAYWKGIQKFERGEFPIADFARIMSFYEPQAAREGIAIMQADACLHLKQYQLAKKVLEKVPLDAIGSGHIGSLVNLIAQLSDKTNVSSLFIPAVSKVLETEPKTREEWSRQNVLRPALANLFVPSVDQEDTHPYSLLAQLNDTVYAPSAKILDAEEDDEIREIANSIDNWKYVPAPVIQKLVERELPFPQALFQTVDFEGIESTVSYLVNHLENHVEQLIRFTDSLESGSYYCTVWKFFTLTACCIFNKWKNEKLSERLFSAYLAAATDYIDSLYSEEVISTDEINVLLPQNCRFAYRCIQAEQYLQAGEVHRGIECLRNAVQDSHNMKDMVEFLCKRMERLHEERCISSAITPELIALAKQIRSVLSQYQEDDPALFVLKSSEQYQKMKFLIEDPGLDTM